MKQNDYFGVATSSLYDAFEKPQKRRQFFQFLLRLDQDKQRLPIPFFQCVIKER